MILWIQIYILTYPLDSRDQFNFFSKLCTMLFGNLDTSRIEGKIRSVYQINNF